MKEIWSTIIAPQLRRAIGEAGVVRSRLYGMTPAGVKSLLEWKIAMYKSNAATHDIHFTSKF
eukprot:8169668-Pyramimonas_sp.AAC.1